MSSLIPNLETFAKGTAATAAGLSTIGMGLLYYGQNYLIYPSAFPPGSRVDVPTPKDFSLPYTDLTFTTPDGIRLKSYLLMQRPELHVHGATHIEWDADTDEEGEKEAFAATRPTILMFHGNGGNHGHRVPLAKIFFVKMRCNVLMLSYRGYGHSEGTPSEKGLQIDAQTALDYVLGHEALSQTPIILYGQSIGGAVAIDLASKNTHAITALILENTFMSLPRLIPTALPLLSPFSFLCHQKWESYLKIPKLPRDMRVLMLGGARDEVVPREQMQGLWTLVRARSASSSSSSSYPLRGTPSTPQKTARSPGSALNTGTPTKNPSPNKAALSGSGSPDGPGEVGGTQIEGGDKYIEFEAGTHNDTCVQSGYWTAVSEFIASLSPATSSTPKEKEDGAS